MVIDILYNQKYLPFGVREWLQWNPEKAPHIIVVGATGSGKTFFSKLLLGKISIYDSTSQTLAS
jgi:pantothenate kinase-related protein Tda10